MPDKTKLVNYSIFLVPLLVMILHGVMLDAYGGTLMDGWYSDIAYHWNSHYNGFMARDIPFGAGWSTGVGKLFILIHNLFYRFFGIGLYQARFLSFIAGIILSFLVFFWSRKFISKSASVLTLYLFSLSPLLLASLPDARPDVIHCMFAFFSFYLITSAIFEGKNLLFFFSGVVSALSVAIGYRGIEIVLAVYSLHIIFLKSHLFSRQSIYLLFGSSIVFIYWFFVEIWLTGPLNYLQFQIPAALHDGGVYSIKTIFSEFYRFLLIFDNKYLLPEIVFLLVMTMLFYKYKIVSNVVSHVLSLWIMLIFIALSLVDRTTYRTYLLMYYPFLYIFAGSVLSKFGENKKRIVMTAVLMYSCYTVSLAFGKFWEYSYHAYMKRDFDLKGYYQKLRASVDLTKNIIGTIDHWYAFTDAQYYGGQFYLDRVMSQLKELKPLNLYKNYDESAIALMAVFKKRRIEYIIADEYFKPSITCYFKENKLPQKNFYRVTTINDRFLGNGAKHEKPLRLIKTEIYKIISYEI